MYQSKLTIKETQKAIKIVKDNFEKKLSETFNLDRVSAPIFVSRKEAINDDLGMKDSALKFKIKALDNNEVEIVQSLAKWKRIALKKYDYNLYEGIYTDMNAIRPKDILDNIHSIYVDQWDWELIIDNKDKNIDFLKEVVIKIVKALKDTKTIVKEKYPVLESEIKEEVFFIDSEELEQMYPDLELKAKEREITKIHKTVFIMKIGKTFKNNKKHDLRAPDYDNWELNGDILLWSDVLDDAVEISSMGIRVDEDVLPKQLKASKRLDLLKNNYHQMIIKKELPQTIGGGIGQSRICMILLEKLHIAEVQASMWSNKEEEYLIKNKIQVL
ncbi:MAG TPA: aspartate--ammonia ligase [Acholeplasmataceae bacterium]|nr:aspartate--ammonia ligase [Acholeplasmataceae bacterium]